MPQTRPFGQLPQCDELLAKGEVFRGELRTITGKSADEQDQRPKQVHFIAPKVLKNRPEMIARTWDASDCKSIIDKVLRIIAR